MVAHLTYEAAARRVTNPRPCGSSLRGQCPLCGHKSALSLRAHPDGNANLRCHACVAPIAELVRALRNGKASERPVPKLHIVPPAEKLNRIRTIWRNSIPPQGTMAESYMRETRGISISLGPAIRFTPRAWHPNLKVDLPAMVCAVTDLTGHGRALHFTWLRRDGDRIVQIEGDDSKTMYGSVAGHAVRFPGAVADRILLAEGIETTLRAKQRGLNGAADWTAWACLSDSGIKNCIVPATVREVFIAADNDLSGAGERAAVKKVAELVARGIKAGWEMPPEVETDYAD